MKRAIIFAVFVLLGGLAAGPHPDATTAAQEYLRSPRLGITHISLAEEATSEDRYQKALVLGAGWNRWPLYWDRVEPQPGVYDWAAYDRLVREDLAHGLRIDAILLGRPAFASDGGRIAGLELPVFADGSDYPEAGKALNPDNLWANFVYQVVARYRPGGLLAQADARPPSWGVRVWEIWNEPDADSFWQNGIADYARLLKVAYIVGETGRPAECGHVRRAAVWHRRQLAGACAANLPG